MAGYADVYARYSHAAPHLLAKWDAIDLAKWLEPVAPYLKGRRILDVGAGSGRLAASLAQWADVTAVEPVDALWSAPDVPRIRDTLPRLARVTGRFDLVLCLGVIHHLTPADQRQAMLRMAGLTTPGGKIIVAARHGPRQSHIWPVTAERLSAPGLGRAAFLRRGALQPRNAAQGVRFSWLVFTKARRLRV